MYICLLAMHVLCCKLHNAMYEYIQLGVNHNIYICIFSCNIKMKKLLAIFSHILYNL
jgi:hypothetical protein